MKSCELRRLIRGRSIGPLITLALLAGCASPSLVTLPHQELAAEYPPLAVSEQTDSLSVMTLNLAHGRSTGFHQALQSGNTTATNLDRIADLIEQYQVQLLALQEADSGSLWSGGFDHVEYLASDQKFEWSAHGSHVSFLGLDYGTALLSKWPMSAAQSVRFAARPFGLRKGLVVSSMIWPDDSGRRIDVVSVHLDPFNSRTRKRQTEELIATLEQRSGPYIVMGDFNTDWDRSDSVVRDLTERMNLQAFEPQHDVATFPGRNSRLDWILISDGLEFVSYDVVPEPVSDHLAVHARIAWEKPAPRIFATHYK